MGFLSKFLRDCPLLANVCGCYTHLPAGPLPPAQPVDEKSSGDEKGAPPVTTENGDRVHVLFSKNWSGSRTAIPTAGAKKLRVVVISDTHTQHADLKLPAGDVLVHCGDAVKWKTAARDLAPFNAWLGTLKYAHKLVICGNHEICHNPLTPDATRTHYGNAQYLQDASVDIAGVVFYGSSWRPGRGCCYRAEAFGTPIDDLKEKWRLIPATADVIITHTPPFGIRDGESAGHIGCEHLLTELTTRVQPAAHCFGHVHHEYGVSKLTVPLAAAAASAGASSGSAAPIKPADIKMEKSDSPAPAVATPAAGTATPTTPLLAAAVAGGAATAAVPAATAASGATREIHFFNSAVLNDEVHLFRPNVFDIYYD